MLNKIFRSRRSKANFVSFFDSFISKSSSKVLFVIKDRTCYSGNIRISLESFVKKSNYKIYFYKDGKIENEIILELKSLGVCVLDGFNLKTIWHILTSGLVILSHNPRDAHLTKRHHQRKIINLWHGVAIKKIELLMPNIPQNKLLLLKNNSKLYDIIIASSQEDRKTNAKAFGIDMSKVILTGLPRYEILKEKYHLSLMLEKQKKNILNFKQDKKLILYAPTFRENEKSAILQITQNEWKKIEHIMIEENAIFVIRPHPYDIQYLPKAISNNPNFFLFSNEDFTEANLILKYTDLLVVDFSSIWIDYLLLKRPIVGFSKDYTTYLTEERGFIYNFDSIFPTTFTNNIDDMLKNIIKYLNIKNIEYEKPIKLFHEYNINTDYSENIYKKIISNL